MTTQLAPTPVFKAFNNNGQPLAGGLLYTWISGTTTPQATFTDSTGSISNTNPVVLSSRGEANVWLTLGQAYTLQLEDSSGNVIWTINSVYGTGYFTQALFNSFLGQVTYTGSANSGYTNASIIRSANFSGGTAGVVNAALLVETNVTGVSDTNYEWASLSILNNYATAGQNVAGYWQANKYVSASSQAGPTWAGTLQLNVIQATPSSVTVPTYGNVALEIDLFGNGGDTTGGEYVGCDLVIHNYTTGTAFYPVWGYRVSAGTVGDGSQVGFAFALTTGSTAYVGFDTSHATIQTASLMMAQSQGIIWDGPTTNKTLLSYDGTGLEYTYNAVKQARFNNTGTLSINNGGTLQPVLGPRISGYGTPTGGSHQPSFAAGSISLANLAACVAQLIVDLETHGMIGT